MGGGGRATWKEVSGGGEVCPTRPDVSGALRDEVARFRVGMIRNFGEECLFIGRGIKEAPN